MENQVHVFFEVMNHKNVKKRRINKNHINLDIFVFINTQNLNFN